MRIKPHRRSENSLMSFDNQWALTNDESDISPGIIGVILFTMPYIYRMYKLEASYLFHKRKLIAATSIGVRQGGSSIVRQRHCVGATWAHAPSVPDRKGLALSSSHHPVPLPRCQQTTLARYEPKHNGKSDSVYLLYSECKMLQLFRKSTSDKNRGASHLNPFVRTRFSRAVLV